MLQVHHSNDTRPMRVREYENRQLQDEWDKGTAIKAALERLEREEDSPPEYELTMWDF